MGEILYARSGAEMSLAKKPGSALASWRDVPSLTVLYHHRTQGRGVEAIHILNIVDGLRQRGHNVTILSPPGAYPETDGLPVQKPNQIWEVVSRAFPQIVFEMLELFYNFIGGLRIMRFLKTRRFDVFYERYALFLFAGVALAQLRKIPIVLEVNDSAYINRVRPVLNKWLARLIEKWVFRRAAAIITITEAFKRIIVTHGVEASRVHVIHNAADANLFSPEVSEIAVRERYGLQTAIVVGFVGKAVPWHGVDTLLRALPRLLELHPTIKILLVGDTGGHQEIHTIIESLDIGSAVHFTGQIPHADVPAHIAAMDIAVMPNSNAFGSPVKIFEYMAMRRAIIAPRCGPVEEVLEDGKTALIVTPGDSGQLIDAIERLAQEPDLRNRLGHAAREAFIARHTWEHNAKRTFAILNDAISQG